MLNTKTLFFDHFDDLQLEAGIETAALPCHANLLGWWIVHLSRCPGKLDHYNLPTSWIMTKSDDFTESIFSAINGMMLDMLAAVARKDYLSRRERAAQGIEKAKLAGKYKGRKEDSERNQLIQKLLKSGDSSWSEIMKLIGCSRGTLAKQAAILKAC